MIRTLMLACVLAWSPPCETEDNYRWWRPDQKRDTKRDEPEHGPRLPHARSVGAGRQTGRHPVWDEDARKRELAQWLSPADDEVGYRGTCELHHSGPTCIGDPRPLPEWVPDSPDEAGWDHPIKTLRELGKRGAKP